MGNFALVTGASKGIGRAMALQLAAAGYNLLLVARSEQELQQLAQSITVDYPVTVHYIALDLSNKWAAAKLADWCKSLIVPVSVLINNAGYGLWGKFEEQSLGEQMNMLNLNIDTVVKLTYLLIPVLRQQKEAFILNVSSTAAYQAVPTLSLYAASKAFILSFSRGLKYELKNTTISVSCLCPGPTATGFASRAGMGALADLAEKFNMKAEDVAETGLKGMFSGKAEIVPGFLNNLSSFAAAHLRKSFIERITARLYKI
ncbi:MAG: SDR family NAD(P)-dependent oxidoreductase [Mucilaginibacter sp.]